MIGTLRDGIATGVIRASTEPEADYRSSGAISQSALKDYMHNPALFQRIHIAKNFSKDKTSAMKMGTAMHCLVLEPNEYAKRFQAQPSGLRKGTKAFDAWATDLGTRDALTAGEDTTVHNMAAAIMENPEARDLLMADGDNELTLRLKSHPRWNIPVQGRLDAWRPKYNSIIDLKGTDDVDKWMRNVAMNHIHIQDFWYSDLAEWALMVEKPWFTFIVCEWDPPHRVQLIRLSNEWRKRAETEVAKVMPQLVSDLKTNTWRRDEPGVKVLELPKWQREAI